jgi:hypothetical protein
MQARMQLTVSSGTDSLVSGENATKVAWIGKSAGVSHLFHIQGSFA